MPNLLNRQDAPFSQKIWEFLDGMVVQAAKTELITRRVVDVEGPYGLGTKFIPMADTATGEKTEFRGATADVWGAEATPLADIISDFSFSNRDIASFEQNGVPFDPSPAVKAAIAVARQEDSILLNGSKALGTPGLLTAEGTNSYRLKSWTDVGKAAQDIMAAVTLLDKAGFYGPYALVLSPDIYNMLFRLYPNSQITELEHIRQIVTEGVVKAPVIDTGGVLLTSGRPYISIAIGQDLMTGFVGPRPGGYEFFLSESIALRLRQPASVCVLKPGK